MEVTVVSDSNNAMLGRREITFSVAQDDRTVSKEELKKELCKKLNLAPELTVITRIDQRFGARQSRGAAHSYKSKEDLERMEPRHIIARLTKKEKKGEGGEASQRAQEPAAEKKEGKKKEE